jgi:type IV fimbrial biogenesis protein FimT
MLIMAFKSIAGLSQDNSSPVRASVRPLECCPPLHRVIRLKGSGFTLIELLVTVSLLGILMVLGLPALSEWTRNSQVRTVADTLQNGIRVAQAEAVRRNRLVVFALTNATPASGVTVTAAANGKNWTVQTVRQLGDAAAEFVQGGVVTDAAGKTTIAGPAAICFNSNGRLVSTLSATTGVGAACDSADTTFSMAQSGASLALNVVVRLNGQVRMCNTSRSASASPDGC